MVSIPNQMTWTDNTVPDADDFNGNIRDTVNFLYSPPRACIFRSSNQVIPCDTWTVMQWSNERYDSPDNMYTTGNRIVCVTPGWYDVKVTLRWQENIAWGTGITGGNNGHRSVVMGVNSSTNGSSITTDFEISSDRRRATDNVYGRDPESILTEADHYGSTSQSAHGYVRLEEDDYIEVYVRQDSREPETPIPIFGTPETPQDIEIYHVPDGEFANCRTVQLSALWVAEG